MRDRDSLGSHPTLPPLAKTKHEVAALLCAAAVKAGFWPVPEFEIKDSSGKVRKVDVVWAVRTSSTTGTIWRPIAAFEIEGHGVARAPASIRKDVASLAAASAFGAVVVAIVLFQVGPNGEVWTPKGGRSRVEAAIRNSLETASIVPEVILDEELEQAIHRWVTYVGGV